MAGFSEEHIAKQRAYWKTNYPKLPDDVVEYLATMHESESDFLDYLFRKDVVTQETGKRQLRAIGIRGSVERIGIKVAEFFAERLDIPFDILFPEKLFIHPNKSSTEMITESRYLVASEKPACKKSADSDKQGYTNIEDLFDHCVGDWEKLRELVPLRPFRDIVTAQMLEEAIRGTSNRLRYAGVVGVPELGALHRLITIHCKSLTFDEAMTELANYRKKFVDPIRERAQTRDPLQRLAHTAKL